MKNQVLTGSPTSRRFALCPSTVKAGDPVLLGKKPAFALDDYSSLTGGTTFLLGGSFATTVKGLSAESPAANAAIKPGDQLYATGTLDSGTNVTTALTIDVNTSNTPFGHLDPEYNAGVGSGATDTNAQVLIVAAS